MKDPTNAINAINSMNPINAITPLELLNLYLTDGKSTRPRERKLYQKFNSELTWDALLNEGYQEDLAPMLYYIITKTSVLSPRNSVLVKTLSPQSFSSQSLELSPQHFFVSDEITNKLKQLYNQYLVTNMIQFKELDTILNAFEKEGIAVIQLKGAWLAKNYYPDPALRPMGDLDLLVRKEDMKRAKECIKKLGYSYTEEADEEAFKKRHYHLPYIKNTSIAPIIVELHFDIRSKFDFINSNINEFWEHAFPINDGRKHILTIPEEYLLLYIIWHTYLSLSRVLIMKVVWLIDVIKIIEKHNNLNWEIIKKTAKKWGIEKQIYLTLYFINRIFNISFDVNNLEKIIPNQLPIKLFTFIVLKKDFKNQIRGDSDIIYVMLLNLISLNSITEKIKYLFSYNSKNPLSKRERIKRKYNLSSKTQIYFYYFFSQILLFSTGIKGLFKIIFNKRDNQI